MYQTRGNEAVIICIFDLDTIWRTQIYQKKKKNWPWTDACFGTQRVHSSSCYRYDSEIHLTPPKNILPPYLPVSVPVFALLSDPVDGVEVFIGAHSRQRILQGVNKPAGTVTVHTGCSAGAVTLLVNSWKQGTEGTFETEQWSHIQTPVASALPAMRQWWDHRLMYTEYNLSALAVTTSAGLQDSRHLKIY